jgi:hypothetical protein
LASEKQKFCVDYKSTKYIDIFILFEKRTIGNKSDFSRLGFKEEGAKDLITIELIGYMFAPTNKPGNKGAQSNLKNNLIHKILFLFWLVDKEEDSKVRGYLNEEIRCQLPADVYRSMNDFYKHNTKTLENYYENGYRL